MNRPATILVVDDHEANRLILHDLIISYGHTPVLVDNGLSALVHIRRDPPDLVLLDILMPELNGHEVLQQMRDDASLRNIPVIVVSSVDELDTIVRCIEAGADDYIIKPFNHTLLLARLRSCLDKKRVRDQEERLARLMEDYNLRLEAKVAEQVRQITATELERASLSRYLSPSLVEAVLRAEKPLNLGGTQTRATVLFADIRGYTRLSQTIAPQQVMEMLNEHFTAMSRIVFEHEGTLDKFIGDSVMAVFGWPFSTQHDERNALRAALRMQEAVRIGNARSAQRPPIGIGIGINTGTVIAGNIGAPQKMDLTVIGDAVNIAARLQTLASAGQIVVGEATYEAIRDEARCEPIGEIELKNLLQPVRCYRVLEPV
ncbi:MAG TPA: adenylate/guanylate cyclase domain-containing protein [bacterium]|jgi:class 3 adenylate cyclase/CheY-like chemotaxis protein